MNLEAALRNQIHIPVVLARAMDGFTRGEAHLLQKAVKRFRIARRR